MLNILRYYFPYFCSNIAECWPSQMWSLVLSISFGAWKISSLLLQYLACANRSADPTQSSCLRPPKWSPRLFFEQTYSFRFPDSSASLQLQGSTLLLYAFFVVSLMGLEFAGRHHHQLHLFVSVFLREELRCRLLVWDRELGWEVDVMEVDVRVEVVWWVRFLVVVMFGGRIRYN